MRGDQVVVVDNQPTVEIGRAEQIRHNMDSGNSYHGLFYFSNDTVEKICQALQMIVWFGIAPASVASDFGARVDTIKNNRLRVLGELRDLCVSRKLRITLMLVEPTSLIRVHNASDPEWPDFMRNASIGRRDPCSLRCGRRVKRLPQCGARFPVFSKTTKATGSLYR